MADNNKWFYEHCHAAGSAFGLAIHDKVHEEKTPYQTIAIYDTSHFGYLMTIDGFVMLTSFDNFLYHEMMSHPALFTHPNPKHVAIIGGGDCGTLREVLKHRSVESCVQVDIDERVTRLSEQYFPELCQSNNDPRATLSFSDGVEWIKQVEPGSLDIIIVDSTDPIGPAEGLFNQRFYESCFNALADNGIVVHQSESPLFHLETVIKPMQANFNNAGFESVVTMPFPQPCYPSGWWSATLAMKQGDVGTYRREDAQAKDFETKYYNSAIHEAAYAQPEMFSSLL